MLPPLDARGLLPAGVWSSNLPALQIAFCGNVWRERLWDGLLKFLSMLNASGYALPQSATLVIGGSFLSDKPAPGDIEVTLVLPPGTPPATCWEWMLLWQQNVDAWKKCYGVDFYPSLPGMNDFVAFFQYVGDKTAEAKSLQPKDRRGVVIVEDWR